HRVLWVPRSTGRLPRRRTGGTEGDMGCPLTPFTFVVWTKTSCEGGQHELPAPDLPGRREGRVRAVACGRAAGDRGGVPRNRAVTRGHRRRAAAARRARDGRARSEPRD